MTDNKSKALIEGFEVVQDKTMGPEELSALQNGHVKLDLFRKKILIGTSDWFKPSWSSSSTKTLDNFDVLVQYTPGGPTEVIAKMYFKPSPTVEPLMASKQQTISLAEEIAEKGLERTLEFDFSSSPVKKLWVKYTIRKPKPIEGLKRDIRRALQKVSEKTLMHQRVIKTSELLARIFKQLLHFLDWTQDQLKSALQIRTTTGLPTNLSNLILSRDIIHSITEAVEFTSDHIITPLMEKLRVLRLSESLKLGDEFGSACSLYHHILMQLPNTQSPETFPVKESDFQEKYVKPAKEEIEKWALQLEKTKDSLFSEGQADRVADAMDAQKEDCAKKLDDEFKNALLLRPKIENAGGNHDSFMSHWGSVLQKLGQCVSPFLEKIPFGGLLITLVKKIFVGFMKATAMRELCNKIGERICLLLAILQDGEVTKLIMKSDSTKEYLMYVYICIETIQDIIDDFSESGAVRQWWTASDAINRLEEEHSTLCELYTELHHSVSLQFMAEKSSEDQKNVKLVVDEVTAARIALLNASANQHQACLDIGKKLDDLRNELLKKKINEEEQDPNKKLIIDDENIKKLQDGVVSKISTLMEQKLTAVVLKQQQQSNTSTENRETMVKMREEIKKGFSEVQSSTATMIEKIQNITSCHQEKESQLLKKLTDGLQQSFAQNESLKRDLPEKVVDAINKKLMDWQQIESTNSQQKFLSLETKLERMHSEAMQLASNSLREQAKSTLDKMEKIPSETKQHLSDCLHVHEEKMLKKIHEEFQAQSISDITSSLKTVNQELLSAALVSFKADIMPKFTNIETIMSDQKASLDGVQVTIKQLDETLNLHQKSLTDRIDNFFKANSSPVAAFQTSLSNFKMQLEAISGQCNSLAPMVAKVDGISTTLGTMNAAQEKIKKKIDEIDEKSTQNQEYVKKISEDVQKMLKDANFPVKGDFLTISEKLESVQKTLEQNAKASFNAAQLAELEDFFRNCALTLVSQNKTLGTDISKKLDEKLSDAKKMLLDNAATIGTNFQEQCSRLVQSIENSIVRQIAKVPAEFLRRDEERMVQLKAQFGKLEDVLNNKEATLIDKIDSLQHEFSSELQIAVNVINGHTDQAIADLQCYLDAKDLSERRKMRGKYIYSVDDDERIARRKTWELSFEYLQQQLKERFDEKHQHTKTTISGFELKLPAEKMYTKLRLERIENSKVIVRRFDADKIIEKNRQWGANVLLVEGRAGIGKTTFAIHAARHQAFEDCFTVMIRLSEIALYLRETKCQQISALEMIRLATEDAELGHGINSQVLEVIWASGKPIIWFVDGFDEVQGLTDPYLVQFLRSFVEPSGREKLALTNKYRHTVRSHDIVILTSREERTSKYNFRGVPRLRIEPWTVEEEVKQYIETFFLQASMSTELVSDNSGERYNERCSNIALQITINGQVVEKSPKAIRAERVAALVGSDSQSKRKKHEGKEVTEEKSMSNNTALGGFATLPIMCEMLCWLSLNEDLDKPFLASSPAAVFQRSINDLCERSNRVKQKAQSGETDEKKVYVPVNSGVVIQSAIEVAFQMFVSNDVNHTVVTEKSWQEDLLVKVGLCRFVCGDQKSYTITFLHKSFLEFFVAKYFALHVEKLKQTKSVEVFVDPTVDEEYVSGTSTSTSSPSKGHHEALAQLHSEAEVHAYQEDQFYMKAEEIDDGKRPGAPIKKTVSMVNICEDSQDRNMLLLLGYILQEEGNKTKMKDFCKNIASHFLTKVKDIKVAFPDRKQRINSHAKVASMVSSPLKADWIKDAKPSDSLFKLFAHYSGAPLIIELDTIVKQLLQVIDDEYSVPEIFECLRCWWNGGPPCFYFWMIEPCGRYDNKDGFEFVMKKLEKVKNELITNEEFNEALISCCANNRWSKLDPVLRAPPYKVSLDFTLACSLDLCPVIRQFILETKNVPNEETLVSGLQTAMELQRYDAFLAGLQACEACGKHVVEPLVECVKKHVTRLYKPSDLKWGRIAEYTPAMLCALLDSLPVLSLLGTNNLEALGEKEILNNIYVLYSRVFLPVAQKNYKMPPVLCHSSSIATAMKQFGEFDLSGENSLLSDGALLLEKYGTSFSLPVTVSEALDVLKRRQTVLPFLELYLSGEVSDEDISQLLSYCRNLYALDVPRTKVTGNSLLQIAQQCSHLQYLNISETEIDEEAISNFLTQRGSCLRYINVLVNEPLNCHSTVPISIAASCQQLRHLDVSGFLVSDESIISIAQACPQLDSLNVSFTQVGDEGILEVAKGCRQLRHLDVAGGSVTDKSIISVANGCAQLESLNVSLTSVTDESIEKVAQQCKELQYLDVSFVHGGRIISSIIQNCSKLIWLDVSWTGGTVTDFAIIELAERLPRLQYLDASFTSGAITEISINQVMKSCRQLQHFYVDNSKDSEDFVVDLAATSPSSVKFNDKRQRLLKQKIDLIADSFLTNVVLQRNMTGLNDGVVLLAEKKLSSAGEASFSECHISTKGAIYLSKILRCNTSLDSIDLSHNDMAAEGAVALVEAAIQRRLPLKISFANCGQFWEGEVEVVEHLADLMEQHPKDIHIKRPKRPIPRFLVNGVTCSFQEKRAGVLSQYDAAGDYLLVGVNDPCCVIRQEYTFANELKAKEFEVFLKTAQRWQRIVATDGDFGDGDGAQYLPRIFCVFIDGFKVLTAMEAWRMEDRLTTQMTKHDFSIKEKTLMALQICKAVHFVHQSGNVMREVRPEKIFVEKSKDTSDDEVTARYVDFPQFRQFLVIGTVETHTKFCDQSASEGDKTFGDVGLLGFLILYLFCNVPDEDKFFKNFAFCFDADVKWNSFGKEAPVEQPSDAAKDDAIQALREQAFNHYHQLVVQKTKEATNVEKPLTLPDTIIHLVINMTLPSREERIPLEEAIKALKYLLFFMDYAIIEETGKW